MPSIALSFGITKNSVIFLANAISTEVKFHWNSVQHIDEDLYKLCVNLEYKLRPKITRFLISRLERECCGDFSCFYFDVDLNLKQITISDKTPLKYSRKISGDFEDEINRDFIRQLFDHNSPSAAY